MDVQSDSSLGAELIQAVVEAALLASSQPLTLPQLQELFPLDQALPEGAVELLAEMREVRAGIGSLSERLGRLEARLRLALAREAA